jgi:hypothetical protein
VISKDLRHTSNLITENLEYTSNVISTRITNLTTDEIAEGNNLYYTAERFDARLFTKTLDYIHDGTSNKFIINNTYANDLYVDGTITTHNLMVDGTSTILNTTTYQTERLEIISTSYGPALTVKQFGNYDILTLYDDETIVFKVADGGNIGVNKHNPQYNLDVSGTTSSTYFIGDASALYNVNLEDRDTSLIKEGSNLYFTSYRAGIIAEASNYNTSNYIYQVNNSLNTLIFNNSNTVMNSLYNTTISISNYINNIKNNLSNQLQITSNDLRNTEKSIESNIILTSNILTQQANNISNILINKLYEIQYDNELNSNYFISQIENTYNVLNTAILFTSNSVTNHFIITLKLTSNTIIEYIYDIQNSNNNTTTSILAAIDHTSNRLYNNIFEMSNAFQESLINTSNTIVSKIYATSNILSNHIFNNSNHILTALYNISNYFIENDLLLSGDIINTSNNLLLNLVSTSNQISQTLSEEILNTCNYIHNTSNLLIEIIKFDTLNLANEILNTSNNVIINLQYNSGQLTEYILYTSNELAYNLASNVDIIHNNINEANHMIVNTSNILSEYFGEYIVDTSNDLLTNIQYTCNSIYDDFNFDVMILNEYIYDTSNIIYNMIINTSNDIYHDLIMSSNQIIYQLFTSSNILYNTMLNTVFDIADIMSYEMMETSNILYQYILFTSNELNNLSSNTVNLKIFEAFNTISATSNALNHFIINTSNTLSNTIYQNYIDLYTTSNKLLYNIHDSSNKLLDYIAVTSNQFIDIIENEVNERISQTSNYIISTSNNIYSILLDTSNKLYTIINENINDKIEETSNQIIISSNNLAKNILKTSNYLLIHISESSNNLYQVIKQGSNILNDKIEALTTDDILSGSHNRFIVNDIYNRDVNFTETVTSTSLITRSITDFGGLDIYNTSYNPSLFINHNSEDYAVFINVNNEPKFVIRNNGFVGINTNYPEFAFDVDGIIHSTRISTDGGLITNVNLSDKNTDDLLEGRCNLYFREDRLNNMIMSKSLDMFQPGSNANIIRNSTYVGSLVITGELTVNSLRILDVNSTLYSNISNDDSDAFFSTLSPSTISNLENNISNVSNLLMNTINNLDKIRILSLDQVGDGTSNRYIANDIYNSSLEVQGRLQAEYLGGNGMFITNVNLLDRTTDDLREGNHLYYSEERFNNALLRASTDNIRQGSSNAFIVNGIYDGDLIVTGELTASKVQILDILTNTLNSNFEPDIYIGSNTYVESLASFIRSVNANLINDMQYLDYKIGLIMTCNLDETILGIIANDSNILMNKFNETINYVNSNVGITLDYINNNISNINYDVYNNISNLIEYVNSNVSTVNYNYNYVLEGSNIDQVIKVIDTSNQTLNNLLTNKILSLTTNNIREGNNLYFTYKRAGELTYNCNLNVSNYIKANVTDLNEIINEKTMELTYRLNILNTDQVPEGDNNLYYTHQRVGEIAYTCNTNVSNYIKTNVNNFNNKLANIDNRISALTLDDIALGSNNTFIKNNVYDGYLIVTGGIITNNVLVYDLNDPNLTSYLASSNIFIDSQYQQQNQQQLQQTSSNVSYINCIEYLVNKVNTQAQIIEGNNNSIHMLTSNLQMALNRISVLESIILNS